MNDVEQLHTVLKQFKVQSELPKNYDAKIADNLKPVRYLGGSDKQDAEMTKELDREFSKNSRIPFIITGACTDVK
jgi:hypothetical protein